MASIDYTRHKEVTELIVSAMIQIGKPIDKTQVKIWSKDKMSLNDCVIGCRHICDKFPNNKILIYTNQVPAMDFLQKEFGIEIYDENKVKDLALIVHDYRLFDFVS